MHESSLEKPKLFGSVGGALKPLEATPFTIKMPTGLKFTYGKKTYIP